MRAPIRAVIFDSDGTLVDSEGPGLDALHRFALQQGLALTREEAHHRFHGISLSVGMEWVLQRLGEAVTPERVQALAQGARAAMNARFEQGLNPMPGADALLSALDLPYCVATNGPRQKVELALGLAGLRHHVPDDRLFSAYDLGAFKPDPALFLHAARALGVDPGHCAVVEDSLPGVMAGLAAGMQVFSLHPAQGLPAHVAAQVVCIAHLTELLPHLPGH